MITVINSIRLPEPISVAEARVLFFKRPPSTSSCQG